MSFNPIEHPICFAYPERDVTSSWTQHIPLGMLLIDLLRPGRFVELGTQSGVSYCALCQAVKELELDCHCYAVDNWTGDDQSGHYGAEVLANLREYHDARYKSFSSLIQSQFDDAHDLFTDGSIDLLHIDGYHTYDAVKHDFHTWLPKMSEHGVVLLHGVAEEGRERGVSEFWAELTEQYPSHLEFCHGQGLGVVLVGKTPPPGLRPLLDVPQELRPALEEFFRELGARLEYRSEVRQSDAQGQSNKKNAGQLIRSSGTELGLESAEPAALIAHYEQQQKMMQVDMDIGLRQYEATIDLLERQLSEAKWQLSSLESSRGVRLVKLARAARAVLRYKGPIALAKQVTFWSLGKRAYYLSDIPTTQQLSKASGTKSLIFISGCAGGSRVYRCVHQAEQLGFEGYTTDIVEYGTVRLDETVEQYSCFILHRVPFGPDVKRFISAAQQQQKLVLFDTDDLVFDPSTAQYDAVLTLMEKDKREDYIGGLFRLQQTMRACDAVVVSTESLRQFALSFHDTVFVVPNAVGLEMLRSADSALQANVSASVRHQRDTVTVGYFSGTATHNRDFLEAEDALLWTLDRYPEVVVKVVGFLDLDERFERFGRRVARLPLQRWQDLPYLYTTVDISIAPLEPGNPFTEAKSCVKYLEAAICKVPTVASPRMDFRRVIVDGENGLLADTQDEWRNALARLVESREYRQEIGQRAFEDVRAHETTLARSALLHHTLRSAEQRAHVKDETQPLTVE
ncbi:MAG: class I SAM-dependent methyltransferase [Ktedonobacterales bacterium]